MENLIARLRRIGFVVIVGVCLIIYIALGILYLQQAPKQKYLQEQIRKASVVALKSLPSADRLQADYEAVNRALTPLSIPEALAVIVSIAEKNGIDVNPEAGKLNIPSPGGPAVQKIGENDYLVLALRGIKVQSEHENVMAFLSDLDNGKTMKTLVLKGVSLSQTEMAIKAEEQFRREEFRLVSVAVMSMMADNGLTEIPAPLNYSGGLATDNMSAFPDYTTKAANRGYTGTDNLTDGYLLFEHDKIIKTDNVTTFETTSYIGEVMTKYYYTGEADGTIRQFDGPQIALAREYPNNEGEQRRTERYLVSLAVKDLMSDNNLKTIPNPVTAPTDNMSAFPDNMTTVAAKGYTGTGSPRNGYVLYQHDRIITTDNVTTFKTKTYLNLRKTRYYYLVEANGAVRQFNGPDLAMAKEYPNLETLATLDVDIYAKPVKKE